MLPVLTSRRPLRRPLFGTFAPALLVFYYHSSKTGEKLYDASDTYSSKEERSILIVGDGDLSYSASRALDCYNRGIKLVGTVLESDEQHRSTYMNSVKNIEHIERFGHKVMFRVDATCLTQHFDQNSMRFDRIQWNFPHCKGRTNARLNRKLIRDFFSSSKHFLHPNGTLHLALFDHQGGMYNTNWKQSWMPARYAAEAAGMLLINVFDFQPEYNISSYQFKDKPFVTKGKKQMYIFSYALGSATAPEDLQLFSTFTAYADQGSYHSFSDFIRSHIPQEYRVDIVTHPSTISTPQTNSNYLAKYSIYLFGERKPITQEIAEKLRIDIGQKISSDFGRVSSWNASHVKPSLLRCMH